MAIYLRHLFVVEVLFLLYVVTLALSFRQNRFTRSYLTGILQTSPRDEDCIPTQQAYLQSSRGNLGMWAFFLGITCLILFGLSQLYRGPQLVQQYTLWFLLSSLTFYILIFLPMCLQDVFDQVQMNHEWVRTRNDPKRCTDTIYYPIQVMEMITLILTIINVIAMVAALMLVVMVVIRVRSMQHPSAYFPVSPDST